MPLLEAAKRIAAELEYSDDDVAKGAKHFIAQMGMLPLHPLYTLTPT